MVSSAIVRPEALTEDHPLVPSPYGLSKLAQVGGRADGRRTVTTRAFNHLGPRQDPRLPPGFAKQIAEIERGDASPSLSSAPDACRDTSDVRDGAGLSNDPPLRPGRPCTTLGNGHRCRRAGDAHHTRVPVRIEIDPDRTAERLPHRRRFDLTSPELDGCRRCCSSNLDDILAYWRS
jgi:hypothetical protein